MNKSAFYLSQRNFAFRCCSRLLRSEQRCSDEESKALKVEVKQQGFYSIKRQLRSPGGPDLRTVSREALVKQWRNEQISYRTEVIANIGKGDFLKPPTKSASLREALRLQVSYCFLVDLGP